MARGEQGWIDQLLDGFGEAVADIRTKLIDEAWFGRRAAPPSQFDVAPPAQDGAELGWEDTMPKPRTLSELRSGMSFEEAWATRDQIKDKLDPDYDWGIDR